MSTSITPAADLISRWPETLIDRIVANDWALVVGAGLSKQASNGLSTPASWLQLVDGLKRSFALNDSLTTVDKLLAMGQYLDAAEIIKQDAVSSGKENDFRQALRIATDGKAGSVFMPSDLHRQIINELAPLLIITTNYDKIIERASSDGYSVHRPGDKNLAIDIRTGSPALAKPHGTIDDLSNIVLTRSDYATIRAKAPDLYRAIEAIFLTKTCLFIGYSFQDPDLMLLLENSFAGKGGPGAHYWLAPSTGPHYLKRLYRQEYGVEMIEYNSEADHSEMNKMISALCFAVSTSR